MKKISILFFTLLSTLAVFAQQKDPFVGFFKGEITAPKYGYPLSGDHTIFGEVFKGPNGYRLRLQPAIFVRAESFAVADGLKSSGDKIVLNKVGSGEKFKDLEGFISADAVDLKVEYLGKPAEIKLKRYEYKSPTLGLEAPAGAIVLFDGKDFSQWEGKDNRKNVVPITWKINPDGSFTIDQTKDENGKKKGYVNIVTKQKFGKLRLHLEFKIPPEYSKIRQARNNSGVIFSGMYEVQILDSFGFEGAWDECGSVYRQVPPMVNACLESGVWQTYDIEFTPAVYDGKKLLQMPKVTARLNGILVQKDTPFAYPTHLQPAQGAKFDTSTHPATVDILLQDHTNPISFRNIWVMPE